MKEISYKRFKELYPLALEILKIIDKRDFTYVEEINKVGDIIKVLNIK